MRLQLFMQVTGRAGRVLHRVRSLCLRLDGALRPVYRWLPDGDRFEALQPRDAVCRALAEAAGTSPEAEDAAWSEGQALLEALRREGAFLYEDVRARLLASR